MSLSLMSETPVIKNIEPFIMFELYETHIVPKELQELSLVADQTMFKKANVCAILRWHGQPPSTY